MAAPLTREEVRRLRQRALWPREDQLGGADADDSGVRASAVVRHLFALQGQDWLSSRWALGVRAPGLMTISDVEQAFTEGHIVRSWPMRGTVHVIASADIGWMQRVTNARPLAGAAKRREFLGIDDRTLDRLVETSVATLAGGRSATREELSAAWDAAGIAWKSNWRYHVVWWLCQTGLAVHGPVIDGEPRLVLASEWITDARDLDGDEALAELAARYTAARGPVQVKDLAWWAGLPVRDVKRGLALAADADRVEAVQMVDQNGREVTAWADPAALGHPANSEAARADWRLLPAFDEHLLGYTDRSAQLAPEYFERVVPGRNGMFLATVTRDGETVATWKRTGTKTKPRVTVTPLPGMSVDLDALDPELRRWEEFVGESGTEAQLA